jgi:general secretion pathway protein C
VVVNYEGATQVLALNKPDYFKGGVDSGPVTKSTKDAGADSVHLDDYLVLNHLSKRASWKATTLIQGMPLTSTAIQGWKKVMWR